MVCSPMFIKSLKMNNEINLKSKNTSSLWFFLVANILFLCGMFYPKLFNRIVVDFDILFLSKMLGMIIAPVLLFLLNGFLSSDQKAILVFWKLKNPLPGSRAFSKLSGLDSRIDLGKLKERYGKLPKSPKKQNRLWYQIYKKNSNDIIVLESHRGYLLARDLTSLCVLFLVFIGVPILLIESRPYSFIYFLVLSIQYFFVVIGAQNRGNRFVTNVLAVESSQ